MTDPTPEHATGPAEAEKNAQAAPNLTSSLDKEDTAEQNANNAAEPNADKVGENAVLAAFKRPELTSLVGAILIFALFMILAPAFRSADAFATVLHSSSTLGIIALGVGLLMIGDEFDLSSCLAVTFARFAASLLFYNLWLNSLTGVFLSLFISSSIGEIICFLVIYTGILSFLISLAMFLTLQGLFLGVPFPVNGQVATLKI